MQMWIYIKILTNRERDGERERVMSMSIYNGITIEIYMDI